ncbi:MAG: PAS domain-containing sensor histidine kinase, partial [Hymenobacter sp.]
MRKQPYFRGRCRSYKHLFARPILFMLPSFPLSPAGVPSDALLPDLLAVSLAPMLLLRPLAASEPADFMLERLNPAAQHLLALPECPGTTVAAQFPGAQGQAALAFCQQAYAAGTGSFELNMTSGQRLQLNARRSGPLLLVSALPDPAAEIAREVAARESAAYAEANRKRAQLYHMLAQAPAMICVFDGPQHVFQFVNPLYQALVGERPLLGLPIAEAMPELADQPIFSLLDGVYQTGETFFANEMLVQLDHANAGAQELDKRYYNFIYQARRNPAGSIDGIFVFAYEVTAQVLARQQVEVLNNELENRIATRAREAEAARADAESQRARLTQLFMQAPGIICVLDGPNLVYQLVNPPYQQVFPGRVLLGRPLFEALPELRESAIPDILAQVYATGESFVAHELPLQLARHEGGPLEELYWTFTYQARRDALHQIDGILVFAYEVSEQVRARRAIEASQAQTQHLADELRRANDLLTRTNVD